MIGQFLFRLSMRTASHLTAVFLLSLLLAGCRKQTQTDVPAAPPVTADSVRSADGVMIQYDVRGKGDRALVFIHCWCCDRSFWAGQVDEFGKEYEVVTLDLAGHGASGTGRTAWTMAAYGADVAAVVNRLNVPEVILIGHSMGGTVMIEAARLLGDRVKALIGVDNLQNLERTLTDEQISGFLDQFRQDFPAVTHGYIRSLFPATADSVLAERVATYMASAPEDIAIGSFDDLFHYDYVTALRDVRLPIRCINSDEYPTDVEANNRVAGSFAVELMPARGHFPHMIDPATFNRILHKTIEEFWPKDVGH
jgi:pimeloyl-ACP methyl ester carboxylesterase